MSVGTGCIFILQDMASLRWCSKAGGGSWSLDWALVQAGVAQFTGTCSYDRAGFGWSEPGQQPRTSEQMVKDLHELLTKADVKKPFILVGASFGGHTVRLYAHHYPEDVAGMVLLDARHEDIDDRMPPAWKKQVSAGAGMYRFMLLASRLNLLPLLGKLMGERVAPPIVKKLPTEIRPVYLAVGFQTKYWEANLAELAASTVSDQQLLSAAPLDRIPLTVIRHGIPDIFSRMPAEQARQAERVWQDFQLQLSQLSENSRLVVAENSGHSIQVDEPKLVVEAIRQVVSDARFC